MVELDAISYLSINIKQDIIACLPMTIRGSMHMLTNNVDRIGDI